MRNSGTDLFIYLFILFVFFLPFEQRAGSGSFEPSQHISFYCCSLCSPLYLLAPRHFLHIICCWLHVEGAPVPQWAMGREYAQSAFQYPKNSEWFLVLHLESQIFPDPAWTHQCFSPSIDPSFQWGRKNWEWFRTNLHKVFPSNSQPPMGFPGGAIYNRLLSPNGFIYYFWI